VSVDVLSTILAGIMQLCYTPHGGGGQSSNLSCISLAARDIHGQLGYFCSLGERRGYPYADYTE